jgi:hypothetical protein
MWRRNKKHENQQLILVYSPTMRTYCASLAQDMKPLLRERRRAFSTIAETKSSSTVAPNAGHWHERLWLGSAGSVRMTGAAKTAISLVADSPINLEIHPHAQLRRERNPYSCARPKEIAQPACGNLQLLEAGDGL